MASYGQEGKNGVSPPKMAKLATGNNRDRKCPCKCTLLIKFWSQTTWRSGSGSQLGKLGKAIKSANSTGNGNWISSWELGPKYTLKLNICGKRGNLSKCRKIVPFDHLQISLSLYR